MRKIIHCDFDCFYAAIEIRDNPKLKGLPIAIGGASDRRGVIATCSYEARAYGIHSAMASSHALRLCPDLVLVSGNMGKYKEASVQAHEIFSEYSQQIEPLSLDEAFLDVSNSELHQGSASLIAEELRRKIEKNIGVTASAGIAPNKFIAKIASDWNKPNGQFTVTPDQLDDFVVKLPVEKIFGVGKVTHRKMKKLGIHVCGDLQNYSLIELADLFGSFGERLYTLCRGIDERPVKSSRVRKSISVENTYSADVMTLEEGIQKLKQLENELLKRCQRIENDYSYTSLYVKVKFSDFTQTTVERSAEQYEANMAKALLETALNRKALGVRLIGLGFKLKPIQSSNLDQMELQL